MRGRSVRDNIIEVASGRGGWAEARRQGVVAVTLWGEEVSAIA